MFARLFSEAGLSLDRLRALVEVGAAGSIVKAAAGDPVKQSQISRQIKELEDFFQIRLAERQGKGIRLTAGGKELARISRFFLLGLSNFQRGCLSGEQAFRIGASATFLEQYLVPVLSAPGMASSKVKFAVETVRDEEIERRLHGLTLDFGVVTSQSLSRPLQLKEIGSSRLRLWMPKGMFDCEQAAARAIKDEHLPLALALVEFPLPEHPLLSASQNLFRCETFLQARRVLETGAFAALLPDFLPPAEGTNCTELQPSGLTLKDVHYSLAWNPRLLRLNPHAARRRDWLLEKLTAAMSNHRSSAQGEQTSKKGERPGKGRLRPTEKDD